MKVDLQDKPADFVEKYREANPNPSSSAKVPILQVGETVLVESMVITEYIADHFGEQGNAGFLPPTAEGRAKARLMVELSPFGSTFGILAKRNEPEALKTELSELRAQLHSFNDFLNVHASAASPFLLDEFCTAEAMLAPFLQRFCTLLPHYCGDEADVRLWVRAGTGSPPSPHRPPAPLLPPPRSHLASHGPPPSARTPQPVLSLSAASHQPVPPARPPTPRSHQSAKRTGSRSSGRGSRP